MIGWARNSSEHPMPAGLAAFAMSALAFVAVAVAIPVPGVFALVVVWYLIWALVAAVVARALGPSFGVPLGIAVALGIDPFYVASGHHLPPQHWQNFLLIAIYIAIGVLAGEAIEASQRRAAAAERARGKLDEEQAALRRIATLVARGVPSEQVFAAVGHEMCDLMRADATGIARFDPDGWATVMSGFGPHIEAGTRWKLEPPLASAEVERTGKSARLDDFGKIPEEQARIFALTGPRPSAVAGPVVVEGRLWGTIVVGVGDGPLPADTEERMADFTELLGIAIANADSRAQLAASRARLVFAGDEARRRIERDLHDGVQQRLVSLSLSLRGTERRLPAEQREARQALTEAAEALSQATDEVREIAHGIHPAILTQGGLAPALRRLARHSAVPVELLAGDQEQGRLPEQVEAAAYYFVAEALSNVSKHACASCATVAVKRCDGVLRVTVRDDGVGGVDPTRGSGLTGLGDRIEALGGTLAVDSRPGDGTSLEAALPLAAPAPGPSNSG